MEHIAPTRIRFTSFPRTKAPPVFVQRVVDVFRQHEGRISSVELKKGLTSDPVLAVLAADLKKLGFEVEVGKDRGCKIERPVFFGENGEPSLRYQIDADHHEWRTGLEVEAGRAILGNAIFRDLFQAMVMTDVDHLVLAVPNAYKYKSGGRPKESSYYSKTINVADALFGHGRTVIPFGLTVVGY
jgi:hypothetical protein